MLDIKQLSYFLALAEHGSISAAANAVNIAQPSLSENIAKLEKKLDVQLAIRGVRGVQLTEAGMVLAQKGREIIREVETLVDEIRQLSGEPRGPVSLGLPPSLSVLLSVPLLETVHSENPHVRLHIAEAMSGDILEWINAERLEVGCVYEVSDSAPYSFEPILTEELFLVTAPDNWEGALGPDGVALEPISASRLQELPLVLTSSTHGARKLQEKFARSIGIQLNVVAEIDSLHTHCRNGQPSECVHNSFARSGAQPSFGRNPCLGTDRRADYPQDCLYRAQAVTTCHACKCDSGVLHQDHHPGDGRAVQAQSCPAERTT